MNTKRLVRIFVTGLFFCLLAGIAWLLVDPLLILLSNIDQTPFSIPKQSNAKIEHNAVVFPASGKQSVLFSPKWTERPVTLRLPIQLFSLEDIEILAVDNQGDHHRIVYLARSNFWQHAAKTRHHAVLTLDIRIEANHVFVAVDRESNEPGIAPPQLPETIEIRTTNTFMRLFAPSIISNSGHVQHFGTLRFDAGLPWRIALAVLVFSLLLLVVFTDKRLDARMQVDGKNRLGLWLFLAGLPFVFSAVPFSFALLLTLITASAATKYVTAISQHSIDNNSGKRWLFALPAIPWIFYAPISAAPVSVLHLAAAWTLLVLFHHVFLHRKTIRFAQALLPLLLFATLAFCDFSLNTAEGHTPIPRIGFLVAQHDRWLPAHMFDTSYFRVNGQRVFQGKAMEIPKPVEEIRVVFLGSSATHGMPGSSENNFPLQLQHVLTEQFPTSHIEVYNAGALGVDTFRMLLNLRDHIAAASPDVLVLYAGNNDLYQPAPLTYREIFQQQSGGDPSLAIVIRRYLSYSALIRLATAAKARWLSDGSSFVSGEKVLEVFRENVGDIVTTARNSGATVLLVPEMLNPQMNSEQKMALIRQMAKIMGRIAEKQEGVFLVDPYTTPWPDTTVDFFSDNVHLMPTGTKCVAEMIRKPLEKLVEKAIESGTAESPEAPETPPQTKVQ